MFCLALWIDKYSLRTLEGADRAPKSGRNEARKAPQRHRKGHRRGPETKTMGQDRSKRPFRASSGPAARQIRAPGGPKRTPGGPRYGPRRPPWAPDEVQKSVGRASGTSRDEKAKIVLSPRRERDFRGPDGPERGHKSAQFGPNVGPEGQSERRLDPNSRTVGRQARNPAQDGRLPPGRGVGNRRDMNQIRGPGPFVRSVM